MRRRVARVVLAIGGAAIMSTALVACGIKTAALEHAGKAASINLSLTTVPTIRSVTVSPASASFATCSGGMASQNTRSTTSKLGFPNGRCVVGLVNPGIYPITITNTGIASAIYVSGSSASPADGGTEWALCNRGFNPFVDCRGHDGLPGSDQYFVENFSPLGDRHSGLSDTPTCDIEFGPRCWAVQGASQTEGLELIGPSGSSDSSTKWSLTITWIPVPSQN
jgi:hypothetical protein